MDNYYRRKTRIQNRGIITHSNRRKGNNFRSRRCEKSGKVSQEWHMCWTLEEWNVETTLLIILNNIINRFINGHLIPKEWKVAYISSIYKKGSKKDPPNSYRGISVTSAMSRLYDKVLNSLIKKEYSSFEEEEQSGISIERFCIDNIFCLKQVIEKRYEFSKSIKHLLICKRLTIQCCDVPVRQY